METGYYSSVCRHVLNTLCGHGTPKVDIRGIRGSLDTDSGPHVHFNWVLGTALNASPVKDDDITVQNCHSMDT